MVPAKLVSAAVVLTVAFPAHAATKHLIKLGNGHCNEGVGGNSKFYCKDGGTCNSGGVPTTPNAPGAKCPGTDEYLLCNETAAASESVHVQTCKSACQGATQCVGFMVSWEPSRSKGRCELHTKEVESCSTPLDCYTYDKTSFTKAGQGACRTKVDTVGGSSAGTRYGYMKVYWVQNLAKCKEHCTQSETTNSKRCWGIEYHPDTGSSSKAKKCEVHYEELSTNVATFQCYAKPNCKNSFKCNVTGNMHVATAVNLACNPAGTTGGNLSTCTTSKCCTQAMVANARRWSLGAAAGAALAALTALAIAA